MGFLVAQKLAELPEKSIISKDGLRACVYSDNGDYYLYYYNHGFRWIYYGWTRTLKDMFKYLTTGQEVEIFS